MSLATWKAEFYPVEASEVTEADALSHSLTKWTGLTPANLKRHGVSDKYGSVYDPGDHGCLEIDGDSCALCVHFQSGDPECARCPLYHVRGVSCDGTVEAEKCSPYVSWTTNGAPTPMINLLKKVVALEAKPT